MTKTASAKGTARIKSKVANLAPDKIDRRERKKPAKLLAL